MKRGGFFAVNGWNESGRKRNGFLLGEMLVASVLAVCLLLAFLPVVTQAVRHDRRGAVREELWRQGLIMDETIYHELRYSTITAVYNDEINFRNKDGVSSGFRVRGTTVYRILSNYTYQPLTGSRTILARGWIEAKPYEGRPYFTRVGDAIHVAIMLEDSVTKEQWPCYIVVVPWQGEEAQDGPT